MEATPTKLKFEDRTLPCKECDGSFVFTARDQEFYQSKGFENEPNRCPNCRAMRKGGRRPHREASEIVCAGCGVTTEVPFRATGAKPLYCRECYGART